MTYNLPILNQKWQIFFHFKYFYYTWQFFINGLKLFKRCIAIFNECFGSVFTSFMVLNWIAEFFKMLSLHSCSAYYYATCRQAFLFIFPGEQHRNINANYFLHFKQCKKGRRNAVLLLLITVKVLQCTERLLEQCKLWFNLIYFSALQYYCSLLYFRWLQ